MVPATAFAFEKLDESRKFGIVNNCEQIVTRCHFGQFYSVLYLTSGVFCRYITNTPQLVDQQINNLKVVGSPQRVQ